jgi:hypothetical protein
MKKRNPNSNRTEKTNQKLRRGLINNNSHTHVQGPLIATCIVLTAYHSQLLPAGGAETLRETSQM